MSDIERAVITNGLEFLESAVDHLAKGGERDLPYAALHLSAAIETLLKARLARERWTLVVENVDRARRLDYDTGDIHSVSITTTLHRLRDVVGSAVTDEEIRRIGAVEKLRNRVAHFALHGENPRRTEATVGRALDVLLHLIYREFLPTADSAQRELVEKTLNLVRVRLGTIQALIRERMNTLRPTLASAPYQVLTCSGCGQPAYVLGDGEPGRCLYCLHHPFGEVAADEYVSAVLRLSSYEVAHDGGIWPVHNCVECGANAFVAGAIPVDSAGDEMSYACFACGHSCTDFDIDQCVRCSILTYRPADCLTVCDDCTADYMAR